MFWKHMINHILSEELYQQLHLFNNIISNKCITLVENSVNKDNLIELFLLIIVFLNIYKIFK